MQNIKFLDIVQRRIYVGDLIHHERKFLRLRILNGAIISEGLELSLSMLRGPYKYACAFKIHRLYYIFLVSPKININQIFLFLLNVTADSSYY